MTEILTPEEICLAAGCSAAQGIADLKCPFPVKETCPLFQPANLALDVQLTKLSSMELEDLREAVSVALGASRPVQGAFTSRLDAVMRVISAWLAAKIEVAKAEAVEEERKRHYTSEQYDRETLCYKKGKQAGMMKLYHFIMGQRYAGHVGIYNSEQLQSFLKENGLEE